MSVLLLTLFSASLAIAQEPQTADSDGSSEQVEESDEAFRRRMELEDARRRDPGYTPPSASPQKAQEKIDELPAGSRANIRDQLVEIIMENGEWEPSDALEEYPYEPTEAAREDQELMQQELEAWDEQVEKYHQREAQAFGAQRPPPPGAGGESPGDPSGSGAQSGEAGGQQGGSEGAGGQAGSAGSYQPYSANREDRSDEASTAGAQQSALDFLRGQGGAATRATMESEAPPEQPQPVETPATAAVSPAEATASDTQDASAAVTERDIPGIIAIEDLDKLEGAEPPEEPEGGDPP